MSVAPRPRPLRAIRTWRCPRCGGDCREQSLRLPGDGEPISMKFLACVGMNCDLVFGDVTGAWMGYQFEGVYVPATDDELEKAQP